MKDLLPNKKILITGASSGIGRSLAVFCVEQGATVVITGRNEKRLNDTVEMCGGPANCIAIACDDLGKVENISTLFKNIKEKVGPLDGVVHSAGIAQLLPLQIVSEENYDEHFNIHVKAATFIAKEFQKKKYRNQDGASLIFISSVAAYRAAPTQTIYAAAKAAQIGLTKTLAVEAVSKNLRVNAIAAGAVDTEMEQASRSILTPEQYATHVAKYPLGMGSPEDVAYSAAFLLSDYAKWITGITLEVDGGLSAT